MHTEEGTNARKRRTVAVLAMVATSVALVGVPASLAAPKKQDIVVGIASKDCKKPVAATIQQGVTMANPGDTVTVCPGTYVEQVTIPAAKSNIELRSQRKLDAIIQAPAVMVDQKAIVRVNGATGVTIRDFTITGPGGGGCDSIQYRVRVDGNGSAEITGNHITKIRDAGDSGCQNGNGIQVGRQSEGEAGSAAIHDNVIDQYQKTGIVVDGTGSSAQIGHNTIVGLGPIAFIAGNGVQISRSATATVDHNDISDNQYSPQTVCSVGVLLFSNGAVTVDHNDLWGRNDCSIDLEDSSAANTISHNKISDNTFDGIDLFGVSNATVSHNDITLSGSDGIFVNADATNNLFDHNKIDDSGQFDADDNSVGAGTGGTANTWDHNNCTTDNHGGALCTH